MSSHLLARPEDVLLAAVAYTRPQMLVLDDLIASQSAAKATLVLPNELLLHIRSDLQSLLVSQLADEATAELFEYESALVEGLCTDCYWWNTDVYGSDVWSWVEHGYRGACACLIAEDTSSVPSKPSFGRPRASSVSSLAEHELDPRHPSPSKRRIQATFSGIQIESRGQWLRTYISRTYFGGEPAWRAAKRILADLGCAHRFERANPNTASDAPLSSPRAAETGTVNEVNVATAVTDAGTEMPALTTTAAETVVALPPAAALNAFSPAHSDTESDLKKAAHRRAPRPCDFGALIKIVQAPSSPRSLEEDASVTLDRLTRELCLRPFSDNSEEPRIPVDCSATRFVDQVYKRNACTEHFISQRQPDPSCMDCMHAFKTATGSRLHSSRLSGLADCVGLGSWSLGLGVSTEVKALAGAVAGAAGMIYLASRGLSSFIH